VQMFWLSLTTGRKVNLSLQIISMELTSLEEALFREQLILVRNERKMSRIKVPKVVIYHYVPGDYS